MNKLLLALLLMPLLLCGQEMEETTPLNGTWVYTDYEVTQVLTSAEDLRQAVEKMAVEQETKKLGNIKFAFSENGGCNRYEKTEEEEFVKLTHSGTYSIMNDRIIMFKLNDKRQPNAYDNKRSYKNVAFSVSIEGDTILLYEPAYVDHPQYNMPVPSAKTFVRNRK